MMVKLILIIIFLGLFYTHAYLVEEVVYSDITFRNRLKQILLLNLGMCIVTGMTTYLLFTEL